MKELVRLIEDAPLAGGISTKIIAIDGCGGAGKSTLAAKLSKYLGDCAIVHTDDFASWEETQGWYPRMIEKVLEPLRRGEAASFQKYNWKKRAFDEWVTIEPQKANADVVISGES